MTTTGSDRSPVTDDPPLVTGCGRRMEVHCLRFVAPGRTIGRIALAVGPDRGGEPGLWAALTPDEARRLGRLLLDRADTAEQDAAGHDRARHNTPQHSTPQHDRAESAPDRQDAAAEHGTARTHTTAV
jgi:hypothetical protein